MHAEMRNNEIASGGDGGRGGHGKIVCRAGGEPEGESSGPQRLRAATISPLSLALASLQSRGAGVSGSAEAAFLPPRGLVAVK